MKSLKVMQFCLIAWLGMDGGNAKAQDIYFNPANAHGTGHEQAISFAAWSWSERSGFSAQYVGLTERECLDGAIVVRTASVKSWPYDRERYPTVMARANICGEGGYLVELRYDVGADQHILTHEIGHTLVNLPNKPFIGTHLTDRYSVMHPNPVAVSAVSPVEARLGVEHARWPLSRPASYCHVELLPDHDLYVPDISGNRIQLSYSGAEGGFHVWRKRSQTDATVRCSNNTLLANGDALLRDIRGQFMRISSARLEYLGDETWRLVEVQD